jgi:hypothetical protein
MSTMTVSYRSKGVLAPSGSFAPLGEAAGDVVGIFVGVLAFLIRAVAVLAPIAGLAAFGWWIVRMAQAKTAPARKTPSA